MPKPYPAAAEPTIDQEAALIEAKAAAQAEADRLAAAAVAQEESERLAALADAQAAKAAPKRRVRKERPPQSIPFFVAEDSEENGALLWVAVRAGPTFLLVGDATGSHPEFAPIATTANDWELRSGQLVFTGNAVLFGQGLGGQQLPLERFALAEPQRGKLEVLATCDVHGNAVLREGETLEFGPGSLIFG